jgi:predicted tellurium resistance membrane protein TerC
MGIAATLIARFMERHHWLSYIGLAVVSYVAVTMIYHGAGEILPVVTNSGQLH